VSPLRGSIHRAPKPLSCRADDCIATVTRHAQRHRAGRATVLAHEAGGCTACCPPPAIRCCQADSQITHRDQRCDGKPQAVVLVEGLSDRLALEVLTRRPGRDLAADGVAVIAMHGATNLGRYLERYGPGGLNVKLAGLCDAAEADYFRRALRRAGIGAGASRASLEALGFFVCTLDLEDELIRALGTDAVERIIAAQGELRSLRTLQRQPAQRGRPVQDQLRRFMSGRSGNKHRYARLLADAMDLNQVPRPLDGVLAHV
jgi:OLD-like protein